MKTTAALFASLAFVATSHAQNTPWTTTGNIGIGTESPTANLDVRGWQVVYRYYSGLDYTQPALLGRSYSDGIGLNIGVAGFSDRANAGTNIGGYFTASSGRSNYALIVGNGNVGIGTDSPSQRFEIGNNGGIGFSGAGLNSADKKLYSPADGVLEWMTHDAAGQHALAVSHQGMKRVYLNSSGNSYFLSGNLGIGTMNPDYKLTTSASDSHLQLRRESTESTGGKVVFLELYQNDPTASIPEVYPSIRFHHNCRFWDRIEGRPDGFHFKQGHLPSDDYVGISAGNGFFAGNVGIGTTSPTEKLSVNGKIRAKEIIVETTGWSDHVFADSYQLQPLAEVEQHIKTEKHLPGVPSAKEVAANGVSVGDMQAILLAKIEELTLHVINQQKQLNAQQAQIVAQQSELTRLKSSTQ